MWIKATNLLFSQTCVPNANVKSICECAGELASGRRAGWEKKKTSGEGGRFAVGVTECAGGCTLSAFSVMKTNIFSELILFIIIVQTIMSSLTRRLLA